MRCTLQDFLADLGVFFASLEDFPLLSTSAPLPSDTVHTVLFLMVALTFLYTLHSLQVPPDVVHSASYLADLAVFFALLEDFSFLSSPPPHCSCLTRFTLCCS
jgi:hypothetical protein